MTKEKIQSFKKALSRSMPSSAFFTECSERCIGEPGVHKPPVIHVGYSTVFGCSFSDIKFKKTGIEIAFKDGFGHMPFAVSLSKIIENKVRELFPKTKISVRWGATISCPEF